MTQAHRDNCRTPYTVRHSHTLMPTHGGLARGQRVRRVSMDESVESEPRRHWSSATHTASATVPRSRAENKSGPTPSIWPAALPDSQPENSWFEEHIVARWFISPGSKYNVQLVLSVLSCVRQTSWSRACWSPNQWIPSLLLCVCPLHPYQINSSMTL